MSGRFEATGMPLWPDQFLLTTNSEVPLRGGCPELHSAHGACLSQRVENSRETRLIQLFCPFCEIQKAFSWLPTPCVIALTYLDIKKTSH